MAGAIEMEKVASGQAEASAQKVPRNRRELGRLLLFAGGRPADQAAYKQTLVAGDAVLIRYFRLGGSLHCHLFFMHCHRPYGCAVKSIARTATPAITLQLH